jgi:hypothetical protein
VTKTPFPLWRLSKSADNVIVIFAMSKDEPEFVIILGQGRSGSTLILRLLNGIPGVRISGENNRAFDYLRAFADCYRDADRHRHSDFYKLAWTAPCSHEQLTRNLRQMIINVYGPGKLIGFKEIRYGRDPYELFADSLDWLREFLPGVRFIFNTRDTESCVHSEWWASDPENSRKILERVYDNFRRYYKLHRDCCYWMPYEHLRHGDRVLAGMFSFLGLDWGPQFEGPLDVVLRS